MFQDTITNPKTNRQNKVTGWHIDATEVYNNFKNGTFKTARDLSWALLNDDQSIQKMEDEQYGDSGSNNFALRIFEQALDWSLGLTVLQCIDAHIKARKSYPKQFDVLATRKGDVFIRYTSGRIVG